MNTKLTMTALLVSSTLVLSAFAAFPAMNSIVFAGDGHDETKHDTNPGQSKDPTQKNHGCPKGEQGYDSSNENCYHPG